MLLTDLPPEILTSIVIYATSSALTRQKKRKELLSLGRTCKTLSQVCLRQIYQKLAYEISLKGLKLLSTLTKKDNGARYASMVRALAVRERESGIQRRPINSREEASTEAGITINNSMAPAVSMSTRAKKMAIDAILQEEKRISDLLKLVEKTLVELKYETNLMPKDDDAFSRIHNLQSLSITAQPLYPDSMDRESMLQIALFALPLPREIFLHAFTQWKHLTHLDLWRCSFRAFTPDALQQSAQQPVFRLQRLGLEECAVSGKALEWLLQSTLQAETLKDLQFSFLTDTETDATTKSLSSAIQSAIRAAGPHLESLKLEIDDGELKDTPAALSGVDEEVPPTSTSKSVLECLGRLRRLHLSGRAITDDDWSAIPKQTLGSLTYLAIYFTPALAPQHIVERLRDLDPVMSKLANISLKGSEDFKRRNLRELLYPAATSEKSEWMWSKEEFVTFVSWAQSRNIQYVADRTIVVGDADEDDASSSADEYNLEEFDDAGDFFVTQEQWEIEKAIEAEELERTWESGSEY
ncbi:hypothetical protein P389DRAFT_194603 [Cystobasidium minutum MCA 4210]|uniref:uncharacterized protein n=1 Tax=Cystobasidium minutum MCA 4210 TaxID=1397322 RepID=UPI0034D01B1F|eukprot:jgi/Rhomi1/194603/gm1.2817_g